MPRETPALKKLWHEILEEKNHHIIVADENGQIISSCVCVIVPNLTHEQRPVSYTHLFRLDSKIPRNLRQQLFSRVKIRIAALVGLDYQADRFCNVAILREIG